MATARIFQEPTGLYHICDDALDYLDALGPGYATRAAALRAAYAEGYDCAIGSGTYWAGVRTIPARYRCAPYQRAPRTEGIRTPCEEV